MDELDLLFQRLVRSVRDQRPEYLSRPFEVSELIAFVPYRAVRAEIGVETNEDYAHALTRLLAGERGYLFADDLLQDDLKAELASPNPDLEAHKAYLNARVSLAQERARLLLEQDTANGLVAPTAPTIERATEAPVPPTVNPAPAPPPITPKAASPARMSDAAPRPVARPTASAPRPLDASADAPAHAGRPGCKYCGQLLPNGREVQFCPHCGQNLKMSRCAACSAELEPGWKFCVACGRAASP
jgi:hypothetical protein